MDGDDVMHHHCQMILHRHRHVAWTWQVLVQLLTDVVLSGCSCHGMACCDGGGSSIMIVFGGGRHW